MVVAELTSPSLTSSPPVASRVVRQWRNFDADAFASDLAESDLLCRLPDTVDAAFDCYDVTLRQLIDKHAPRAIQRCRRRTSAAWFDGECREMKRATRRLEKTYRRPKSRTTANHQACGVNSSIFNVACSSPSSWTFGDQRSTIIATTPVLSGVPSTH